jgi:UDP-N-acetylglucosamine kinase
MINDDDVQRQALAFAKANKKKIAQELTDPAVYPPEPNPVAVFMAGSPGAGKTEASMALVAELEAGSTKKILRVDPDDLRCRFPSYSGNNSYLFQGAISILVDKVLDYAHANRQSFLLDGTLAAYEPAYRNIKRCVDKQRKVQILYVYLDPIQAWTFVQAREIEEGRNIPVDQFISQYFAARDVVNALKAEFGSDIMVDLLIKPNDSAQQRLYKAGIDKIDYHVPEKYDRASLENILRAM